MGDGRWAMGDGRWAMEPSPAAAVNHRRRDAGATKPRDPLAYPHPAGNEYQTAAATACSGKHPCLPCNVSIPGTRSRTGSRIESQAGSLRLQRVERLGAPTSRGRCGRPSSPSLVTTTKTPRHQGFTKTIAGETPALQTGAAPCNTRAPAGEGTTAGVLAVAPP